MLGRRTFLVTGIAAGAGAAVPARARSYPSRQIRMIVHVPFKGASEVFTAILGGQVHLYFGDIGGMLPLIRQRRLKALALSGLKARPRASRPADHDRERGAGLSGLDLHRRDGSPAATPPAIVAKINASINYALQTPEVTAVAARLNADVEPVTAEAFGAFLAAEYKKWSKVVRTAGIKIE
ncbi:MAG: hypothetical protein K2Z80_12190 [Xanthobacteraceae bacterium]|nr:hypothetical protein [Xanthobacteraceae bacterium]